MGWIGWELHGTSALIVNLGFPLRAGLVIVAWCSRWPVDSTESVLLQLGTGYSVAEIDRSNVCSSAALASPSVPRVWDLLSVPGSSTLMYCV